MTITVQHRTLDDNESFGLEMLNMFFEVFEMNPYFCRFVVLFIQFC